MITIPTVDQLDLGGSTVFYRVDYNVPIEGGHIADATRIEETIPTILMMRERGAKIVIASHLGRPKGERSDKFSLHPVRKRLKELLNLEVGWAHDAGGEEALRLAQELSPGGILMLENLRFEPGEELNDLNFAAKLRALADVYVNDAFGASHRAHASIVALAEKFPAGRRAGGLLLAKELAFLQKVTDVSERPFVAILGGAKIAGKIEPLEALVKLADTILIGGGMANTFLVADGRSIGSSLVDHDSIEIAKRILKAGNGAKIVLPVDLIVTDSINSPTYARPKGVEATFDVGDRAVDIGPATLKRFAEELAGAKTIFWNGPMGVFEKKAFAAGTEAVAREVANAGAISIVGGGESVEAVNKSGFAPRISHISTGGGASLEFIAGMPLPGVEVLRKDTNAAGD